MTAYACARRTGELHPSFPSTGQHAATPEEKDIRGYLDVYTEEEAIARRLPRATFKYTSGKGNTSLKYHLERYHLAVYNAIIGPPDESAPRKRPVDGDAKPGEATLGTFFKSVKKLKRDSTKAKAFFQLVALVIVFCRLPFNLVVQPIFKALVWFLDPTLPMPTRGDITNEVLPRMVKDCKETVCRSLETVVGASVTFDLWMSMKTDDILSVDLHFISHDWVWHHTHLGLVAMNGITRGPVIAKKLKEVFEEFNMMGKLYAMVFDGGANLSTAKTELVRLHGTDFCCAALEQYKMNITSCLAHLINNSCNGAVLAAKAANYKVGICCLWSPELLMTYELC